jgi:hypothetical protein
LPGGNGGLAEGARPHDKHFPLTQNQRRTKLNKALIKRSFLFMTANNRKFAAKKIYKSMVNGPVPPKIGNPFSF